MPESAREFFNGLDHRRWEFFYGDNILPAGMSPRPEGKWVKFEDVEAYASSRVAALEQRIADAIAILDRPYDSLRELFDSTDAALARLREVKG